MGRRIIVTLYTSWVFHQTNLYFSWFWLIIRSWLTYYYQRNFYNFWNFKFDYSYDSRFDLIYDIKIKIFLSKDLWFGSVIWLWFAHHWRVICSWYTGGYTRYSMLATVMTELTLTLLSTVWSVRAFRPSEPVYQSLCCSLTGFLSVVFMCSMCRHKIGSKYDVDDATSNVDWINS